MRCVSCQQQNADSSLFCIHCGTELLDDALDQHEQSGDVVSGGSDDKEALTDLRRQVRSLRREVNDIRATLSEYGIDPRPLTGVARGTAEIVPYESAVEPLGREQNSWERFDWEPLLGGNWLARIGALAMVIGTGFFLKLAFDNDWVNGTSRVVLGVVAGVAFLSAGEYWHIRYRTYAQAMSGAGGGILYLSIFAAFALYGLIGFYPAVGLLFLVSVTSTVLALRYESVALAIIGIVGAFSAPFILSGFAADSATEVLTGDSLQLITYIIVVDLGVLVLSTFRNWRWFTLLALLGSLASYSVWYDEYGDTVALATSQVSITIIFLTMVGATSLFHFVRRRTPQAFDYALMSLNAASYLGISYGLMWDELRPWMGGFTLLLTAFYAGMAYMAFLRNREQLGLSLMLSGIALVFLTIAAPVQFGGPLVSIAWSVQAVVLVWLAVKLEIWQIRVTAAGVFASLTLHLLVVNTQVDLKDFVTVINMRMLAYMAGIVSMYLAVYLLRTNAVPYEDVEVGANSDENHLDDLVIALQNLSMRWVLPLLLLLAANFLTLWVLSAEVIATVDSDIVEAGRQAEDHIKSLSLSLLWAVYASAVLVVGIVGRWPPVRVGGLALLCVPVLKLFVVDTFQLEQGYRVAAYLSLGAILLMGGFLYQRFEVQIREFLFEEPSASEALS